MEKQPWRLFTSSGRDSAVTTETGYSAEVLDYVWWAYSERLDAGVKSLDRPLEVSSTKLQALVYIGFAYIHQYPRSMKLVPKVLSTPITGAVSPQKFYAEVVPVLLVLSRLVEETFWEDRLHPYNHGSHLFKDRFTTIFDGTDINVSNLRKDR